MATAPQTGTAAAPPSSAAEGARRIWGWVAWISGVFVVLVGTNLLAGHLRAKGNDPWLSPRLKAYKESLRASPADKQLKENIRRLDLELRQRYFRHLSRLESGAYLLLGGAAAFVVAVSQGARHRKRLPMPAARVEDPDRAARSAAGARWAAAAGGGVIGAFLFIMSLSLGPALPRGAPELERLLGPGDANGAAPGDQPPPSDAASLAELRQNWPCFRGVDGGVSASTNAPASWDAKTGAGIVWKVPSPTSGFNSPIVWGDRVFLSGGDAQNLEVVCLDAKAGQVLWRQPVAGASGAPSPAADVPESTGCAAPTMATDGRRVYAIFANGDCVAFTLEGQPVWSKSFGALSNPYGHAASLATWRDRLIVQLDQGHEEDNQSKLYALDGRTGQVAWQRPRRVGATWSTPIVIEAGGQAQVITLAAPHVVAYAAADGAEVWRAECLNGEITPSPVFAGGLLLVVSPMEKLLALRADGRGDVTKTHLVWTSEESVPDVTSPLGNGELAFMITTPGMLTCLDAKSGQKQWEHDFELEFHASPSLAGNRLYLFSQKGTAHVIAAAREFKELFRTEMGDSFHASPAFAQDKIFLRGVTNVWCLGAGAGQP